MSESVSCLFRFAGSQFCALPDRALWWPDRRILMVADLHLEKASWFAASGQLLPPYDSLATIERLAMLADRLDADAIWALGDSFHDRDGVVRLDDRARDLLAELGARRPILWVSGNHDGLSAATLGGGGPLVCDAHEAAGITFRHAADPADPTPEVSGHYHPKIRLVTRARAISRPCFLLAGDRLVLPAFGALTGGLDVRDAAYDAAFGRCRTALVPTIHGLLRFPVGQPLARVG